MTKEFFNLRNVVKIGVTCLAVCTMFSACKEKKGSSGDKDDGPNSNMNPSVIEVSGMGNSNIATVKIIASWEDDDDYGYEAIISVPYQNGGFKMTLPETIPDKYLQKWDVEKDGITVSDPNARVCIIEGITAYSSAEKAEIGYFYPYLIGDDMFYGTFYRIYADRDFTIKGKNSSGWGDYLEEWDCSFKKGWNMFYYYYKGGNNEICITQKPSNIGIKWTYSQSNCPVVRFKKENANINCTGMGIKCYYSDDDGYGYVSPRYYFSESLMMSGYDRIYNHGIGVFGVVYYDNYHNETTAISNYNFVANKAYTVVCGDDGSGNPVISVVEDGQKSLSSNGQPKASQKMLKR
jgi:hypothetical protein